MANFTYSNKNFIEDWNKGFFATFFVRHIAIYPLVRFYVFRLAHECLFAERPAVEAHIVEVCPCIIDDVKAVGTRLVPRKAHA